MINPRWYQSESIKAIYHYFMNGGTGNPLIGLPTGCHAAGTKILMYDGSVKNVEDILIDDLLMGPDSNPRKVLNLARGKEPMVKIIPTKGEEFTVNLNHILCLKTTQEKGFEKKYWYLHNQKGNIKNIKVEDYLISSKWFKHITKLWRSSVEFSNNEILKLDPYFMGLFLGDGGYSHQTITFTSIDEELLNYCRNIITSNEIYFSEYTKDIIKTLRISTLGIIGNALKFYGLNQKTSEFKFIPSVYKTSTRYNRLEILAGLLDTDGSLSGANTYDYISKSKQLAEDIVFISRSLGFAAYIQQCEKQDQNKTKGIYYRVSISGDTEQIPVLLERKKAKPRLQKKDILVTGFKTEILPEDNFYGFELDVDHLYLDANFIVHHNTGKSLIPALFIYEVMQQWPNQRFLLLTHVKELIEQNAEVIREVWHNVPLGIYSAGLKEKNPLLPVCYAGIQSAKNHPYLFGHRDIVFIDEAHLVNLDEASMYNAFLAVLKIINPKLKVIGLSATLYRMGQGMLHDEGLIFTDVIYDKTNLEGFNQLLADGFMKPLIPLRTKIQLDISNVGIQKGEFIQSQLQHAVDVAEVTWQGLRELVEAGQNRRSWLLFASGIEHAEHISAMLSQFGISCTAVHSKQSSEHNDQAIRAFKDFSLRAIVNYGKLTTGFNHPAIDLIGMFRPTMSVPLWVQMLGRGTRPEGQNCLVLDYARNASRLGPINDPVIPRKKGEGAGEVPIKLCERCGAFNHIKVKWCINCGTEFSFEIKITKQAASTELIKSDLSIIENFPVENAYYQKHEKQGKSPCLKVTYVSGLRSFTKYLFPQHLGGLPRHTFYVWWRQRHQIPPPATVDECLKYTAECKLPSSINVWLNKTHPSIEGEIF